MSTSAIKSPYAQSARKGSLSLKGRGETIMLPVSDIRALVVIGKWQKVFFFGFDLSKRHGERQALHKSLSVVRYTNT